MPMVTQLRIEHGEHSGLLYLSFNNGRLKANFFPEHEAMGSFVEDPGHDIIDNIYCAVESSQQVPSKWNDAAPGSMRLRLRSVEMYTQQEALAHALKALEQWNAEEEVDADDVLGPIAQW